MSRINWLLRVWVCEAILEFRVPEEIITKNKIQVRDRANIFKKCQLMVE